MTRVWPVAGRFSATQRAAYEIVLASQLAAIAAVKSTSVGERVKLPDSLKGNIAAPSEQFKN